MGKIISNGIEYSGIQGTTVIANPESSPTDELSSIQIGSDVYSISGGSSSSWTDITGTLTTGETEITLSSAKLGVNSTLDFYTSKFGVNPIDVEINSGTETQLQEFVSSESELDGIISASSYLNDSYAPWKAFLDSTGYGWVGDNISEDAWLAYDFGTNVTISKVQWTCGDNSRRGILSKLQYSSDGTTWNDATLSTNERCNVVLQTPTTARYWRMYYNAPFSSYQQPMVSQLRFLASGYSVTLTFEEQEENLGVKVRIY